jgi:hypothetical protein
MDDPDVWLEHPMHSPPADIDIAREQEAIDRIYGTAREGASIMKLVWSGDKSFWHEFHNTWDGYGKPLSTERYPQIRYKVLRDEVTGEKVRDVFPPRWLIMCRLEPEQYEKSWVKEAMVYDSSIKCHKPIRPLEIPPVFWLWWSTIARHSDYCCGTKRKENKKCFGEYAPPAQIHQVLFDQKEALKNEPSRNPYAAVDAAEAFDTADFQTGYKYELIDTLAAKRIYMENPFGLIGVAAAQKANISTFKQAQSVVREYFDRKIQDLGGKA